MKNDDDFVAYYEVFQQKNGWYFLVPPEHTPFKDGDMLVGPYATAASASKDVATMLLKNVMERAP